MKSDKSKKIVEEILSLAGIKGDGKNPWDIEVHNKKFYGRVLAGGSLALGESYMDGWWECDKLDEFFYKVLRAGLDKQIKTINLIFSVLKAKTMNLQRKSKAYEIGSRHYDVGNDLFKYMLDERMVYSCGYWKKANNLNKAQEDKLDLICRKIGLTNGTSVLDIGCGWGSFVKFASERYGAKVLGIAVSKEQVKLAKELCKGLDVEIRLQDYRDINETFDRVVSIGMIEHVGVKNYKTYMKVANKVLKDGGLFLLHTIGRNNSVKSNNPWIHKYIFPNSMLPSAKQLTEATEGLFILEDWHNFGLDYYKTLIEWHNNFTHNWNKIKKTGKGYDERFYRMWTYYLLSCAGDMKTRNIHLWQIVFSKIGTEKKYESIR